MDKHSLPANNRFQVLQVLAEDWFYRKQKRWPLIKVFDIKRSAFHAQEHKDDFAMVFYTNNSNYYYNIKAIAKLNKQFIGLEKIFSKYRGKIVVAGGAVTRALYKSLNYNTDCDLFFYNTTKEEAEIILMDCISLLSVDNKKMTITTKKYVTTVMISRDRYGEDEQEIYQFIHRIYPTKDSIIGGFDLGPAMMLYDGNDILTNPLGAYCIQKSCLIVDTSRRSTSFEYRIEKYYRLGFKVIFPGITVEQFEKISKVPEGQTFYQKCQKVNQLISKLGLEYYFNIHHKYQNTYSATKPKILIFDTPLKIERNRLTTWRTSYTEKVPISKINYYTDYGDDNHYIAHQRAKMNNNHLITGNLEAVGKYIEINGIAHREQLENFFFHQGIAINDDPITTYKKRAFAYLAWRESALNKKMSFFRSAKKEICLFAEFVPKVRKYQNKISDIQREKINNFNRDSMALKELRIKKYTQKLIDIVDIIAERIRNNYLKIDLSKIHFIEQDPQRQWTSSINPIMKHPREFYGEYYIPCWIGIPPEVESALRLFQKKKGNYFNSMGEDLFNMVLRYVFRAYVFNPFTDERQAKEQETLKEIRYANIEKAEPVLIFGELAGVSYNVKDTYEHNKKL